MSPMEGAQMMSLETSLAIPNGHVNGHGSNPGIHDTVAVHLDQQANISMPWDRSPPMGPIAVTEASSAVRTTGDVRPQLAIGPAANVAKADTKQEVAKTKSSRSKINYVPQDKLDVELAKLEELSQAALAGDTSALDQLRAELDNCPHVWRRLVLQR